MNTHSGVIPKRRGPYVLVRKIGGRAVHEVFEARKVGTAGFSCTTALKSLRPELRKDRDANVAFEREACLVARADHANVVMAQAFEEDEQGRFLVMEYVAGPSLASLITEKRRLSAAAALFVMSEILEALVYLHDLCPTPVVHRNLVADNVLLSPTGHVKVIDFGHAAAIQDRSVHAGTAAPHPGTDLAQAGALLARMLPPDLAPPLRALTRQAQVRRPKGGFEGASPFRQAVLEALEAQASGFAHRDLVDELRTLNPPGDPAPDKRPRVPVHKTVEGLPGLGSPSFVETSDVIVQAPRRPTMVGQGPPPDRAPQPDSPSFFLRSAAHPAPEGPLDLADLFERLAELSRANRRSEVSIDGRNWLETDGWFGLLGEPHISFGRHIPFDRDLPFGHIAGRLEARSLFALCAQLTRAETTGRLTLVREGEVGVDRVEIHLQLGTLAAAFSNPRTAESWAELVGRGVERNDSLRAAVHQACRTRTRLNLGVSEAVLVQVAQNRRTRTVLQDAAQWTTGDFVFDPSSLPVVHAKLLLLPTLVEALREAHPQDALDAPRVSFGENGLVLSEHHAATLEELGLSIARHFDPVRFGDGRTWEETLEGCSSARARKNCRLLGYVLSQLGLLRPGSAPQRA